jgi:hypothetical protein
LRNTNLSRTKINFYANFNYKLKIKNLELNEEFDAKAIENLILAEFDREANLILRNLIPAGIEDLIASQI